MGNGASNIKKMGGGGCGAACAAAKAQQDNKPKPAPDPIYFNPYVKKQKDADAYDSTIGQSRFQGTAPRHF